jgi:transposase InsO family protein
MFQALWRSNVGWDDHLSQFDTDAWQAWFTELKSIGNIHIPRCYNGADILERELHVFADASELAYVCVAYWRFILPDGSFKLALIGSKARVTPLKPVTVPRLELQAALIASRFAVTIIESHRNKPIRVTLWSDSRTVLSWLRADARTFRPFVAHRVGEIIENTNVCDWRWVPTDLNVADDSTRIRPIDSSSRWFIGPSFLLKNSNMWPTEPTSVVAPVLTELKTSSMCEVVGFTSISFRELMPTPVIADPAHFSSWTRLVRATARAHQAAKIFKNLLDIHAQNSKSRNELFSTPSTNSHLCNPLNHRSTGVQLSTTSIELPALSADEMEIAEKHMVRHCQLESFEEELRCILTSQSLPKNSPLRKLSPSLGEDHILRLAGRISAAPNISNETRSPILLDGRHAVARLLIHHYHKTMAHANVETVVNEMRQKYWILRLRPTTRTVAKCCLFCRIRNTHPTVPPTGNLPSERLAFHQRPFTNVGLDYFGPVEVTVGRRKEKRYVALYTCLTVRAMHLEVVNSLSTDSAIMSLRRFIARRGSPLTIISDNGTAFVGASNELKQFFGRDVEEFTATRGIKWKFIPPAAPFFGGCWERLVRSTKTALRATLNERAPKEETFLTLLMEAEAIVNSRPLSHVSVDKEDEETLTPFHFLIGQSSFINSFTAPTLTDSTLVGRSEWRKASRLADHFWARWMKEVLPLLHTRPPAAGTYEVKIGDVVIIADDSLPRRVWPKGRVTQLHPGRDGKVRVVDVATKGGTLRRPIRKIIFIS